MRKQPISNLPVLEVLEEHFEELASLWAIRETAAKDAAYQASDIDLLDEAIEAHTAGLVIGGEASLPILADALAGDEAPKVSAAAAVLLCMRSQQAGDSLMDAFAASEGMAVACITNSLSHAPIDYVSRRLKELYEHGPPLLAAAAAEVFARHGRLSAEAGRLKEFHEDEDPEVRKAAWRITGLVDGRGREEG